MVGRGRPHGGLLQSSTLPYSTLCSRGVHIGEEGPGLAHLDAVEHRRVGPAGAHGCKASLGALQRLVHLLQLQQAWAAGQSHDFQPAAGGRAAGHCSATVPSQLHTRRPTKRSPPVPPRTAGAPRPPRRSHHPRQLTRTRGTASTWATQTCSAVGGQPVGWVACPQCRGGVDSTSALASARSLTRDETRSTTTL